MSIKMKDVGNITLSAFAALAMTGCLGGGGGGGGGGPSIPVQPVVPVPVTPPTPPTPVNPYALPTDASATPGVDYTDPGQFEATTYSPDWLTRVNAFMAHDTGFTGGDISQTTAYTTVASDTSNRNLQTVIAVLDSGINANHTEFSSAGKIAAWQDFSSTASATPIDDMGHGTMVSSIAAGDRNSTSDPYYGMAYNSQILAAKVFNPNGFTYGTSVSSALNWVVTQKASLDVANVRQVVAANLSLGTTNLSFATAGARTAMTNALNSGVSLVMAAGNSGLDCVSVDGSLNGQCNFPAATAWIDPLHTADYLNSNGGYIVVGSVDANNNLSYFSNKAGVTKSNYLVAPGEWLYGADKADLTSYVSGYGTSYATPIVTGAMALMAQKWPHITGRQHAQILFDTATDLGAAGVDDVYGNGLLNLHDAFNPVGTVAIPAGMRNVSSRGATASVSGTSIATPAGVASFGDLSVLNDTIMIDSYSRDFKINMTSYASSVKSRPYDYDSFSRFSYGNFMFGADMSRNLPMAGYRFGNGLEATLSYDAKSMLGVNGTGAFEISGGRTAYLHAKKDLISDDDVSLSVEGTYAYGSANASSGSLITGVSDVHALGGKVRASIDGFGVGYEIPLRVVSGAMSINTPTDIDNNGNVVYTSVNADLAPDTFEQTYSLFYEKEVAGMRLLAQVSQTKDAFGIDGYINNEAKVYFNMYY